MEDESEYSITLNSEPLDSLLSPSAAISLNGSGFDGDGSGVDGDGDGPSKQNKHVMFVTQPRSSSSKRRGSSSKQASLRSSDESNTNVQHVRIRKANERAAMDENTRFRSQLKKRISSGINQLIGKAGEDDYSDDEGSMKMSMHGRLMVQPSRRVLDIEENVSFDPDEEEKKRAETQYRLTSMKKNKKRRTLPIPGMYEDTSSLEQQRGCSRLCPSSDVVTSQFLHWSFRSPFVAVFGTAAIGWFALTISFALVFWVLGTIQPECIGGVDYKNISSGAKFVDAYQMSWTTFSTVGYGLVHPATSANHAQIHQCTLLTILTCFESFVGVLFSSLCAALMFAKIARVQSFAQVTFSTPIVIRYGSGLVMEDGDDDDDADDGAGNTEGVQSKHIPCPVLEFRIFNRLSSLQGGEVIDATLNMVASIDASQADSSLTGKTRRRKKGKKKRGPTSSPDSDSMIHSPPMRNESTLLNSAGETSVPEIPMHSAPNRHQSVASRDSPLPGRGPAPSLVKSVNHRETNNGLMRRSMNHQETNNSANLIRPPPRIPHGRRFSGDGKVHQGHNGRFGGKHSERSSGGFRNSVMNRFHKNRQRQESGGVVFADDTDNIATKNTDIQAFDEDPSGKLMSKKILAKLEVESPDHPFFRRIWLIRHTLDMNSLLLKPHVRHMLRRNHGYWPKELNNYESIRASIEFDQILVSLSGTSNADANSVFAQHVFHMVDVNIGYRFVNALYRNPTDASLQIDHTLINDVMEQAGKDGGEPLQYFDPDAFHEMLVL